MIAESLEANTALSGEFTASDFQSLAGLRVMLVDDEPEARQILSTVIARRGAEVRTCESARDALNLLSYWRPDVLISDLAMPDEDGYSLIRSVRSLPAERGGQVPAAALSAYARDEDRRRALSSGISIACRQADQFGTVGDDDCEIGWPARLI